MTKAETGLQALAAEGDGTGHELPSRIGELVVPQAILERSARLIAPFRKKRVEGALLWYGYRAQGDRCIVTTCVSPDQTNTFGSYSISAESMRAVRRALRPYGLLLLVQVHTHPGEAYFSDGDAEHALNKRAGALNMILPNFGRADWVTRKGFAMAEREPTPEWRIWDREDWTRIRAVPTEFHGDGDRTNRRSR